MKDELLQPQDELHALISALGATTLPRLLAISDLGRALFVGSGDSLSACLLTEPLGHRAASAGDIAWTGRVPPHFDTVVGVSRSGRTQGTIAAIEVARKAGLRTVALTVNPDSTLVSVSDQVALAPNVTSEETIPAAGYISLALSVLDMVGEHVTDGFIAVADCLSRLAGATESMLGAIPERPPSGISVLSLPDMRSAGDFWSLKLIEATGLAVRSVPLEESGHVDYFIGPQAHSTIQLVGQQGRARHARLAEALEANGHAVTLLDAPSILPDVDARTREISLAAYGAHVAHLRSSRWNLTPFRNGEVPMDAQHIQLPE
jgi:fructoselysine-6-P-deglycase FrlB-like protein